MDIALFTDTFDEINGVAKTLNKLTEYAARKGIFLEVFAPGKQSDFYENVKCLSQRINSIKIHRYKSKIPIPIYTDLRFDLKVLRNRIITYCEQAEFDLIHTATPGSMGLNALYIAKHFDVPLIGSYHTALPAYIKRRVQRMVKRFEFLGNRSERTMWHYMSWYYKHCQIVLAPSMETKYELEQQIKDVKVDIFSRGIDTKRYNRKYRTKRLAEHYQIKNPIALYVGRVSAEKDLEVLVSCFKDYSRATLVVVGDGPYLSTMRQELPEAVFLGFKKGEELSEIYASSDFFVFPSTTDTFGNVVLEAMASGLPGIVSDSGGPKELVEHGKTGFITIAKDIVDFKAAVDNLASNSSLRKKMTKRAIRYANSRSWDKIFDGLFSIYREYAK